MCCIVTKCRLLAQVSREKIFFSICENFLDFGKILGLYTILDFHEICLRIYEFKQDLKLFSWFDKLFKSDFSKRYREIRNIFSDLQNIFGLSLFDFRTEVFELFVLFWLQLYNYFTLIHISYTKNGQNKVVLGYYNFG